jgi:hypothetical protein
VQAVENLSSVEGTIMARRPHPALRAYDLVTLLVKRVVAIEGKADLISTRGASALDLGIRQELLGSAREGDALRCRAKLTAGGVLCEPFPATGDFELSTAQQPRK